MCVDMKDACQVLVHALIDDPRFVVVDTMNVQEKERLLATFLFPSSVEYGSRDDVIR